MTQLPSSLSKLKPLEENFPDAFHHLNPPLAPAATHVAAQLVHSKSGPRFCSTPPSVCVLDPFLSSLAHPQTRFNNSFSFNISFCSALDCSLHQQQKHKNACIATLKYKCLCSPSHISFCASCLCTPLQQNSWKVFFFPLVVVSSSSFLIVKPFGLAFASQLQQKYFCEGHQWPLC